MARRSREAIQKRLRERKRAEKAALKRQKRLERKKGLAPGEGELEAGGFVTAEGTDAPVDVDGEQTTAAGEAESETEEPAQPEEDPRTLHPTLD